MCIRRVTSMSIFGLLFKKKARILTTISISVSLLNSIPTFMGYLMPKPPC